MASLSPGRRIRASFHYTVPPKIICSHSPGQTYKVHRSLLYPPLHLPPSYFLILVLPLCSGGQYPSVGCDALVGKDWRGCAWCILHQLALFSLWLTQCLQHALGCVWNPGHVIDREDLLTSLFTVWSGWIAFACPVIKLLDLCSHFVAPNPNRCPLEFGSTI